MKRCQDVTKVVKYIQRSAKNSHRFTKLFFVQVLHVLLHNIFEQPEKVAGLRRKIIDCIVGKSRIQRPTSWTLPAQVQDYFPERHMESATLPSNKENQQRERKLFGWGKPAPVVVQATTWWLLKSMQGNRLETWHEPRVSTITPDIEIRTGVEHIHDHPISLHTSVQWKNRPCCRPYWCVNTVMMLIGCFVVHGS